MGMLPQTYADKLERVGAGSYLDFATLMRKASPTLGFRCLLCSGCLRVPGFSSVQHYLGGRSMRTWCRVLFARRRLRGIRQPDQVGAVSCAASICFFAGSKAAVITAVVNWAIGINLGNVLIDGDDEEPLIITSADCRAPSEPNHDGAKSPRSECRGRDPRNVRRIPSKWLSASVQNQRPRP